MISIPIVVPSVRVPRPVRARWAAGSLVVGFAVMPHLLRSMMAIRPIDPTASAVGGALLLLTIAAVIAVLASGHATWGALDLDEVERWFRDALVFSLVCVGLFLPASMSALATPPLLPALAGVILPAASEEFAYRGVLAVALFRLLPACKVRAEFRTACALVLSGVAFAAAHDSLLSPGPSLVAAVQRAVAGLLLGVVALRSRSLLAPMFAHAAFNAVVLAPWIEP